MPNKFRILTGALLAAVVPVLPAIGSPKPSPTSPKPTSSPTPSSGTSAASASVAKMRLVSFRGMIVSVDQKAKTFVVNGKEKSRSVRFTDKTVVTKLGQPGTIKDITINQEVRGTCLKDVTGSFEAKTIKLGPLTEAEKAAQDSEKEPAGRKIGGSPVASPTVSASPGPKT